MRLWKVRLNNGRTFIALAHFAYEAEERVARLIGKNQVASATPVSDVLEIRNGDIWEAK